MPGDWRGNQAGGRETLEAQQGRQGATTAPLGRGGMATVDLSQGCLPGQTEQGWSSPTAAWKVPRVCLLLECPLFEAPASGGGRVARVLLAVR